MSASFVDLRQASFSASTPKGLWSRLRGQSPPPIPILKDITFSLNLGDWVTLYGGPGAGKSTLLRLLSGMLEPASGAVSVNGRPAHQNRILTEGFVTGDLPETFQDSVGKLLATFGKSYRVANLPARLALIAEALELRPLLKLSAATLSATERVRVNLARAALSNTPLILLDDVAEYLGVESLRAALLHLFEHRTVIVATRSAAVAEQLKLPVLLLHRGTLACSGTCEDMGKRVAVPRTLDVWFEGIRYDIFRTIKKHPGVAQVLLVPDGRFHGQRLRITLKSSHHLPALYDLVSRVPVLRVEELPVSLEDILSRL